MLSLQNAEVIVRTGKLAKPKRSKLAAFLLVQSPFLCYKYRKFKFFAYQIKFYKVNWPITMDCVRIKTDLRC